MRFAGATFEKGKPRGRLHTEGYATLHNADGGRCLLDPKLIPVYTPGPASVYAVFNLPRARTPGLPFGRSTVERIADPLAPPRTAHLQKSTSERYCDAHPRDDDESDGEYAANEMAPDVAVEKAERFRAINAKDMDKLADKYPRLKDKVVDIKRSALIFPFKASPYLVDELIDWDMAGAYLGVLKCCGAFTPSTRLVSRREGAGWSFCRV